MRIVMDLQGAQTSGSRPRGIGRYSLALAGALARVGEQKIDLRIALNAAYQDAGEEIIEALADDLPPDAFSYYSVPSGAHPPPLKGDPAQHLAANIVRLHYASLEPHVVLVSSMLEGFYGPDFCPVPARLPGVVDTAVLYDLIPMRLSDAFLRDDHFRAFYRRQTDALKTFDRLLAISESTRSDAVELLDVEPAKIESIGGAVPKHFRVASRRPKPASLPSGRYVLTAGGQDPHKRVDLVFRAFNRLPSRLRENLSLVHVGLMPEIARQELQAITSKEPIFLGYADERLLIDALDHAALFVFPSLYEGFGLPVLEAMTRGTPVLASRSSSLPEVVGDEALLFEPGDEQALADAMERVLDDDDERSRRTDAARRRAENFTWEQVAKRALNALEASIGDAAGGRRVLRCPRSPSIEETISSCADILAGDSEQTLPGKGAVIDAILKSGRVGAELGPPRLLVDVTVTSITDGKTGIQRVVRNITGALCTPALETLIDREVWPISFEHGEPTSVPSFGKAKDRSASQSVLPRTGDTLLMLDLNWLDPGAMERHCRATRAAGGSVYTIVYDLVPVLRPDVAADGMKGFEAWFHRALLESDGLICISRAVADEVLTYVREHDLPFRDGLRIGWWRLGSDLPPRASSARARSEIVRFLDADLPTFVMVGTVEPRKRHAVVLDAMERLWAEGRQARLLILGKEGWRVQDLAERLRTHPEQNRRLLWPGAASDAEIGLAYERSTALVFASIYEGFGLPIVEAGRAGLPVIASDIPVLREVGGEGTVYVPPEDPEALADAMRRVLGGEEKPDPSAIRAITWETSADELLDVVFGDDWYARLRRS